VKRATIRIDRGAENVAGVFLPILKVKESEDSDNALAQIGMDRGGAQI
jgi:vacuolar-type H+-ATPase subunit D/Vma8